MNNTSIGGDKIAIPDIKRIGNDLNNHFAIWNQGMLDTEFYRYGCDFFCAADTINICLCTTAADRKDIGKLDVCFFALMYLYRQSLELMLKASIFDIVQNDVERKEIIGRVRHDVKQIFDELTVLKGLTVEGSKNGEWLSEYLSDIAHIDNSSDMFRYPFVNDTHILFDRQAHISLIATQYNMERAFMLLRGIYDTGAFLTDEFQEYLPKLFVEGGTYYQQSVLGYKFGARAFYPFYVAYREVGEHLAFII